MGHSRTYNFWVNVNMSDGFSYIEGSQSIKEAIKLAEFYKRNHKSKLIDLQLIPQTAVGKRITKKDYILINSNLEVEHKKYEFILNEENNEKNSI